jgi:hypothetical protein
MLIFFLRLEPFATSKPAMARLLEMITLCLFNYDLIGKSLFFAGASIGGT